MYRPIDDVFEELAIRCLFKVHKFKKKKVSRLEEALRFAQICMRHSQARLRTMKRG